MTEQRRRAARGTAGWVEQQILDAQERGDFDNLPGAGKPLRIRDPDDPDWWVKGLMEREQISGVLPPPLALRKERRELPGVLDALASEEQVREVLTDFNSRVRDALLRPQAGPRVVVGGVDVEEYVAAWRARRTGMSTGSGGTTDRSPRRGRSP